MNMIIVFMTFCLKYNITGFLIFCFPNARISFKKIYSSLVNWTFLVAQLVKNPPAMQEILVLFLGLKVPLEKG